MSTSTDKAAQLKAEGNALFVKKDFKQAIQKYGEAIDVDGKNAILYSNRAACHLNLQQYEKAISDAEKAAELDPTYSKAWSRLATAQDALYLYPSAKKSYQRAIDALPKESLTPAELTQKKQYEAALEAVTLKQQNLEAARNRPPQQPTADQPYIRMNSKTQRMPWVVANELIPKLRLKENYFSSAYLIGSAEASFQEANRMMYSLRKVPGPMGDMFLGITGAIEQMSNAIMLDKRVFRLESMEWVQKYNDQVTMETTQRKGPDVRGSAESIIDGIRRRFEEGGFDASRPCASLAVRSIIMQANVEAGLKQQHELAVERYDKALAILKWGREQWKDVSREDRGSIFEDSFVRGVRDLRLEAYMEAWAKNKDSTKFSLAELLKEAEDILAEVRAHPCAEEMKREDPGFALAFWSYVEGHALAMIGFVKNWAPRVGRFGNASTREEIEAMMMKSFQESAHAYFEAADKFPEDDEAHVWYLNCGIDIYWRTGIPLKVSLPIMARIRKAHNTMRKAKIWENSAMSMQGRDQVLQRLAWFEEDVNKAMAEGQFDEEAQIMPSWCQPENNDH